VRRIKQRIISQLCASWRVALGDFLQVRGASENDSPGLYERRSRVDVLRA
jgi:hypothetical protein